MPFIVGDDARQVKEILQNLPRPVKLVYFTQELECQYCRETHQLVEELRTLSNGKVQLEIYNFVNDKPQVEKYKIDKIPAIAVTAAGKDYGIRYYGIPTGYEFSSIMQDIQELAQGEPDLSCDLIIIYSAMGHNFKDLLSEARKEPLISYALAGIPLCLNS